MAKFRMVYTAFWYDPKVSEDLTPEDKLFFLYLLTNPWTTQIGVYPIRKRQIACDLGFSLETIDSLLDRFIHHHELIRYNPETRELAIKNWGKYNLKRGGKPMHDCIKAELKEVKDEELIKYVAKRIEHKEIKKLFAQYLAPLLPSTQQKTEEEAEKDQEKGDIRDLFDHFVSKNIIRHKKMTNAMITAIRARLKDYTYDELKQAIDNYAEVYFSDTHWFTHKYPLADLMRDKDIRKFLDEADPIHNFSNKEPINLNKTREIRKEDFDLS